jgi:hypothetical protein
LLDGTCGAPVPKAGASAPRCRIFWTEAEAMAASNAAPIRCGKAPAGAPAWRCANSSSPPRVLADDL